VSVFTGLVGDIGTVEGRDGDRGGARLRIATRLAPEIEPGDSVSVSGACLTAAAVDGERFEADVMSQTLELTSLGGLAGGERVNLELALRPADRIGGHIVQGHVDGTGLVTRVSEEGIARRLAVEIDESMRRYVVPRGSVALDGVSLTVAGLGDGGFEVALIPETLERTTLGDAVEGRTLNVELDVVGRYVESFLAGFSGKLGEER